MKSQDSRGGAGRRSGRGPRRTSGDRTESRPPQRPPVPLSFWQKLLRFFRPVAKPNTGGARPSYSEYKNSAARNEVRGGRKPEVIEVTSPKLYIGNLSYEATENDLLELFNGVGKVVDAEVVSHKETDRSKGFGFVTMGTVDEARRAVTELHDKSFMGRKLVVSGAKVSDREPNYRG